MNNFQSKLILVLAIGALILGIIPPSYAATSIHVSARAEDTQIKSEANANESIFPNIDINELFSNFFGRKVKTEMEGEQEVPGPGDIDGEGKARIKLDLDKDQVCADIEVDYIEPATAAHIHFAPKGAAGAVVVPLPTPDAQGEAEGCVNASHELIQDIKDNPQDYYVNVHNGPYPNGAIRGQLSR